MDMETFDRISRRLDSYREQVIELQSELVRRPAISPGSGGVGEAAKAEFLKEYLEGIGLTDIQEIRAPDDEAPAGYRPNLIARIEGRDHSRTVWFMAHMDVVPPGDLDAWDSDPFQLRVDGDELFGRGTEDNHQGLVASVMAARALLEEGVTPAHDVALMLVADEETGSDLGIGYVVDKANPFRPEDIVVVPDGGLDDGSMIEVAEKSILWPKITVTGRTAHGSTPDLGRNATRAAAHMIVRLEELQRRFPDQDPLFDPPGSTFAPTKREPNVENINSIPDRDVFYLDCRLLPKHGIDEVVAFIREHADAVENDFGVTIEIEFAQREDAAPPTASDATVVKALRQAIWDVYEVEASPGGIGGGTVAAVLRRAGIPAAVWCRMEETMHGPNESCLMSNLLGDAKVFAHLTLYEG